MISEGSNWRFVSNASFLHGASGWFEAKLGIFRYHPTFLAYDIFFDPLPRALINAARQTSLQAGSFSAHWT